MKTRPCGAMPAPSSPLTGWGRTAAEALLSAPGFLVFAFLDLLDVALCFLYGVADAVLEGKPVPSCCCCCWEGDDGGRREGDHETSETLNGRRNIFRGIIGLPVRAWRKKYPGGGERGRPRSPRWSDCCCRECVAWVGEGGEKLHFAVKETSPAGETSENVIFLHGFLSSSSLWMETVFPNLSEAVSQNYRLFAIDLLGFGRSPKPADCFYTVEDHIRAVERSVIEPLHLDSFHLVGHSMGCIIALAIAAKHGNLVKSITLVAPPYFCSTREKASHHVLNTLAAKRLWPLPLFGSSIMSWYEHVGRTICFIICRNHRAWEWILRLFVRRDLPFMIVDATKHTHHSAWHIMHNVICGSAEWMDRHLETVSRLAIPCRVIHGSKDQMVPLECSYKLKSKVPFMALQVIPGADHITIILGREEEFTKSLEEHWSLSAMNMRTPNGQRRTLPLSSTGN